MSTAQPAGPEVMTAAAPDGGPDGDHRAAATDRDGAADQHEDEARAGAGRAGGPGTVSWPEAGPAAGTGAGTGGRDAAAGAPPGHRTPRRGRTDGDPQELIALALHQALVDDPAGARMLLERAVRHGDPLILCSAADIHLRVLDDPGTARDLYEQAARHGSTDAMGNLGLLLTHQGRTAEAEHWLRQAALHGDGEAANHLGRALRDRGEAREAINWFRLGADAGSADAMGNLALLLIAEGREADARPLLRRAGAAGDELAAELAEALGGGPPPRPAAASAPAPAPAPAGAYGQGAAGPPHRFADRNPGPAAGGSPGHLVSESSGTLVGEPPGPVGGRFHGPDRGEARRPVGGAFHRPDPGGSGPLAGGGPHGPVPGEPPHGSAGGGFRRPGPGEPRPFAGGEFHGPDPGDPRGSEPGSGPGLGSGGGSGGGVGSGVGFHAPASGKPHRPAGEGVHRLDPAGPRPLAGGPHGPVPGEARRPAVGRPALGGDVPGPYAVAWAARPAHGAAPPGGDPRPAAPLGDPWAAPPTAAHRFAEPVWSTPGAAAAGGTGAPGAGAGPGAGADPLAAAERARRAYARTRDPELLATALELCRTAVDGCGRRPVGDPYRTSCFATLGVLLRLGYERDRSGETLAEAVAAGRAAVAEARPEDPEFSRHLCALAVSLLEMFTRTCDLAVLDESIALYRRGLSVCPSFHPRYAGIQAGLSGALLRRAQYEPDPEVLDEAVRFGRAAVRSTPTGHPQGPTRLAELGAALLQYAIGTSSLTALDEAIEIYRRALSALPAGHPSQRAVRTALDSCLRSRKVLHAARERGRAPGAPRPAGGSWDEELRRASAFLAQYELTGELPDLERAITGFEATLRGAAGVGIREAAVARLGTALWSRYERGGDRRDLDQAVDLLRESLLGISAEDRPAEEPGTAGHRARRYGDASGYGAGAAGRGDGRHGPPAGGGGAPGPGAPAGPPGDAWAAGGSPHGDAFAYDHDGASWPGAAGWPGDAAGHGPAAGPAGDPADAVRARLSAVLRLRWLRAGDTADLAAAVELARAALAATPPADPRRCGRLLALGTCLTAGFAHSGDRAVLAETVEVLREAVALAPAGGVAQAWARSNLAEALLTLSEQGGPGSPDTLDEAVALTRAASAAVPADLPLHQRFLSNLSRGLLRRYTAHRDAGDLAAASTAARAAVAGTPPDHPGRPERLSTLITVARLEYDLLRTAGALDELIRIAGLTAQEVPSGHPVRARALTAYAWAAGLRGAGSRDPADLLASEAGYRQVAEDPTAAVGERVRAAQLWAYRAHGLGGAARAMAPATLAVELLPRLAPPARRPDGSGEPCPGPGGPGWGGTAGEPGEPGWPAARRSAPPAGPASYAAACAIELGDPERALRLLEHGRAVLLAHALGGSAESAALHTLHPGLVDRFRRLREVLDESPADPYAAEPAGSPGPFGGLVGGPAGHRPGEDRHALAEEWEQVTDRIRRQPGFEGFLRPPELPELLDAARGHGPVVVLNVSRLRCDALLLTGEGVRAVPLPALGYQELSRRTERFLSAVRVAHDPAVAAAGRQSAQTEVHELLEWLWETVADPVLRALRLTGRQRRDRRLPHLWWVPTGPLTALPLHAAQRRTPAGAVTDAVLDRVVSSYAPSVRELVRARARQRSSAGSRASSGAAPGAGAPGGRGPGGPAGRAPEPLVVAPAADPGAAEPAEPPGRTAVLPARLPHSRVLTGDRARRDVVVDTLARHRWAHFACHAVSALDDAAASRVVLAERAAGQLTVADIAGLALADAELAYLSACTTTSDGGTPADGAVHISGAFQLAGYTHVVGTLWPVADEAAVRITEAFYASLTAGSPPTADEAAYALHQAVRGVREAHPAVPTLWAGHLHMGP
ncbi:CHAT domain-containing protein [Streptomyces sp. NPDC018031]|uniref:CHAT domain-containing protein n=1 Tax=Streptomyces sp. NPDC018031 TaxID=3365033 RepID=UPI0037AEB0B5